MHGLQTVPVCGRQKPHEAPSVLLHMTCHGCLVGHTPATHTTHTTHVSIHVSCHACVCPARAHVQCTCSPAPSNALFHAAQQKGSSNQCRSQCAQCPVMPGEYGAVDSKPTATLYMGESMAAVAVCIKFTNQRDLCLLLHCCCWLQAERCDKQSNGVTSQLTSRRSGCELPSFCAASTPRHTPQPCKVRYLRPWGEGQIEKT